MMDNLNKLGIASIYAAFPPEEARRLAKKLEVNPTPVHSSWLDMAELELGVLTRQALGGRSPDLEIRCRRGRAWQTVRSQCATTIDLRFSAEDA